MKYRIDTVFKRGGREVYIVSKYLNKDGSLTINAFPDKTFKTREEAIEIAENTIKAIEDGVIW